MPGNLVISGSGLFDFITRNRSFAYCLCFFTNVAAPLRFIVAKCLAAFATYHSRLGPPSPKQYRRKLKAASLDGTSEDLTIVISNRTLADIFNEIVNYIRELLDQLLNIGQDDQKNPEEEQLVDEEAQAEEEETAEESPQVTEEEPADDEAQTLDGDEPSNTDNQ